MWKRIRLGLVLLVALVAILFLGRSKPEPDCLERKLSQISDEAMAGRKPGLKELLGRCGKPDSYFPVNGSEMVLAYFYDRFGTKDWVAYVDIEEGVVTSVGYNDASVNDHSDFLPWEFGDGVVPGTP